MRFELLVIAALSLAEAERDLLYHAAAGISRVDTTSGGPSSAVFSVSACSVVDSGV